MLLLWFACAQWCDVMWWCYTRMNGKSPSHNCVCIVSAPFHSRIMHRFLIQSYPLHTINTSPPSPPLMDSVYAFGLCRPVVGREQQVHVSVPRITVRTGRTRRPRTRSSASRPRTLWYRRGWKNYLLHMDRRRFPNRRQGMVELKHVELL